MKRIYFFLFFLYAASAAAQPVRSINMDCPGCTVTGIYTTSSSSFTGLTNTAGSPGTTNTFTLSGTNISNTTTVTFPTGYEGCSGSGCSVFGASFTIAASSGGVTGQPVTVSFRLAAANTAGTYSGTPITIASTAATTSNVTVSGTTASGATATLSLSKTLMSGFTTTAGTASSSQGYGLSGTNLTAGATVSAPTCCQISLDGATWSTSLTPSYNGSGGLTGQPVTVYGRISAAYTTTGAFSQSITNASTGATNQIVTISGTVGSVGTNDTVDVQLWDSVKAAGKYTATGVNNWAPVATAGLTSAFLKYRTTSQSPLQTVISVVNDYHDNGAGWAATNTTGYPAGAFNCGMFNTATATLVIQGFTGISTTGVRIEIITSVDVTATGGYPSIFTVGAISSTVNAALNTSNVVVLDGLTPDGLGKITINNTFSNTFNVIDYIRIIIKH